jgi:predicted nucleic acid-binding protein
MTALFVDTAGWACLADRRELNHRAASQHYQSVRQGKRLIVTTNYILAELVALLTSRTRLTRTQVIAFIESLKQASFIQIVYIDEALDTQAWQLLKNRADKEWSLVDCASFVVMQQRNLTEALTTDHHFEQAGFVRLLRP